MSKRAKSLLLKYGISLGVVLVLAVPMILDGWSGAKTLQDQYRILSDSFTVPGLLFLFSGLTMLVTNEGALYGIGFIMSYTIKRLIPGKQGELENYAQYVERKKRNRVTGFSFLFVVAAVCLVISGVFIVLFYQAYQV